MRVNSKKVFNYRLYRSNIDEYNNPIVSTGVMMEVLEKGISYIP